MTTPSIKIVSNGEQDVTRAVRMAERADPDSLIGRQGASRISPAELPFLNGTEEGRAFLAEPGSRAIARGMPAESCPAIGLSTPDSASSRSAAVRSAMTGCFDALRVIDANPRCGCRLLAFDNIVAVPRDDMVYSTGISARLTSGALGIDTLLVADDLTAGQTELRDLTGSVGIIRHIDGTRAELELADEPGVVFSGNARPLGYRRGRIAEVMRLSDPDGREILLVIGLSPQELARLGDQG